MKIIKYHLIGAIKAGVNLHPQIDVKGMGMVVSRFEGVPMGDFVIMEVDDLPQELPDYIEEAEWTWTK